MRAKDMLTWNEVKADCKTERVVTAHDGVETYFADLPVDMTEAEAKSDFISQSSKENDEGELIDWSDTYVSLEQVA